ncbi:MAG: mechanosensitive ion channel domain-containing protein [Halolamina sp.]|uniref:mechanosensitive ion channel domain-containing protein n=1 Tax=Halolamina sp. TaxID=1940283 RepID=UPI002FC38C6C
MTQAAVVLQSGVSGLFDTLVSITSNAVGKLVSDVVAALPRILAGIIFLIIAALGIKLIRVVLGYFLSRTFPNEPTVYRQFIVAIVMLFLWFGVGLSFLAVVGMEQIAASLGSAAGFLALGVSYALSNVIADVVAGVYLLRDEDFMPGDRVDIGGTVGTVQSIELRKTRLTVNDGEDTMVRNNTEIEKKWTKLDDVNQELGPSGDEADDAFTDADLNDPDE